MPSTVMPGTIAASRACGSGTNTRSMPRAAAAITIGSTPGTERSPPVRVSSPMKTVPPSAARGIRPSAASTDTAIARSKWVPLFSRSAGESRIVIRFVAGQLELAVDDRHPAAVAGLVQRRRPVGRPGWCRPGRATRRPGRRSGGRALPAARWCGRWRRASDHPADVVDRRRATARAERRRPGRSAASGAGDAVRLLPADARARPAAPPWSASTASCGCPQADAAAGLHLAHDEHPTVAQDEVDLARLAPPVAVEQDHALLGTRCRAASDSPYAPSARLIAAVVEPVIC